MSNQTKNHTTSFLESASESKIATQDTDRIDRPEKIVDDFIQVSEPFACYKSMVDHLQELMFTGFFNGLTGAALRDFSNHYFAVCETIFQLEKHAEDHSLQWHIGSFAKHVMQKSPQEIEELDCIIKSMVKEYGSLKNGLHHLANLK